MIRPRLHQRHAVLALLLVLPRLHAEEPVLLDPVEVIIPLPADALLVQPTPVTAYSGGLLASAGVTAYEELAPLVPGFFASAQSVDNVSLNLRGLVTDGLDPRVSTRVPVFQDGVVISSLRGGSVALFDLEGVEVLKGPQPSSFGRGVQNGALALTGNPARDETAGELTVGVGDDSTRLARGFYNAPIIPEKLFVRAAFTFAKNDGYVGNLVPGAENLQGRDTVALRTSFRWQASPGTTADLIVNFQHDTPPGIAFKSMVVPTPTGDTDPYTPAALTRGNDLGIDRDILGITGILRHTLNESWTLTSTSAFRQVDSLDEFDADGSALYLFEFGEDTDDRQFSQELRFDYNAGDRLTGMIGASVVHSEARQDVTLRTNENTLYTALTGLPPPGPFGPLLPYYEETYSNRAGLFASDLFGCLDYKLASKLTVGASLRVTREHIRSGYQSLPAPVAGNPVFNLIVPSAGGGNDAFRPTPGLLETSEDYTSWSGRLDARYAFTPRHHAYAGIARGRRPQVLTFDQTSFRPQELGEERVWNYEAGFKGTTATQRLQYGVSVFKYVFDNFQTERAVSPGVTAPFDGGRAHGQGLEVTLQGALTPRLALFATYGFTDAEFDSSGSDGQPQAYAGNSFRLTSRHTLSLGTTLTLPVGEQGAVFISPVAQYRSEHFFEDDNAAFGGRLRQGGFTLLNLRLGYRPRHHHWEITGYINNLLDKEYLIDAGNIGLGFGFPTSVRGAPRSCGVQVTARF